MPFTSFCRWFIGVTTIAACVVHAQGYRGKLLRLIVGFVPSGGSDFIARITRAGPGWLQRQDYR